MRVEAEAKLSVCKVVPSRAKNVVGPNPWVRARYTAASGNPSANSEVIYDMKNIADFGV